MSNQEEDVETAEVPTDDGPETDGGNNDAPVIGVE
jgi:hypothetical protein